MYFTQTPTYPFGYGLSYSHFAYSHINIASRTVNANSTVPVSFDVTNTGTVPGATVAQVYAARALPAPGRLRRGYRLGSGTITVQGAIAQHVQYVTVQPDQVIFKPGDTLDLSGKNPWLAPDTNSSLEQPHAPADSIVEAVNNDESFVDLSHASVSYSSSNPNVAAVSSTGKLTAVGHGVATISVTVNGVTGTTRSSCSSR